LKILITPTAEKARQKLVSTLVSKCWTTADIGINNYSTVTFTHYHIQTLHSLQPELPKPAVDAALLFTLYLQHKHSRWHIIVKLCESQIMATLQLVAAQTSQLNQISVWNR